MPTTALPIDREQVAAFCRRHHIRSLSLFGSILRDDFRLDSDVDVLVNSSPEKIQGWRSSGCRTSYLRSSGTGPPEHARLPQQVFPRRGSLRGVSHLCPGMTNLSI